MCPDVGCAEVGTPEVPLVPVLVGSWGSGLLVFNVSCGPESPVSDPEGAFPGTPDLMLAVEAASSNVPVVPEVEDGTFGSVVPRPWVLKGFSLTAL